MLSFTENKKKRSTKAENKTAAKEEHRREPAWHDSNLDKLKVSIEEKSRLRKLKKSEAETHIQGNDYA